LGLVLSGLLLATHPAVLPYALVFFGGLLLAIPLAVLTSQPSLGRWMMANRLLSLPEEINPPEVLLALDLKALKILQTVRPPQQS
jgi:membrane glycosyltransferase